MPAAAHQNDAARFGARNTTPGGASAPPRASTAVSQAQKTAWYNHTMQTETLSCIARLSDSELVARVKNLAGREREAMAEIIAHLGEIEARNLYAREGYKSLFEYCRVTFRFSEQETYNRIAAARTPSRFPVTLELLADGSINLTTVRLLAPHLTAKNHRTVLDAARGKRTYEVEKIVASLAPKPDVADSIRKLPSAPQAPRAPASTPDPAPARLLPPPPQRPAVTALAPERYKLQFTIPEKTLEKLDLAKDMLRHAVPSGDLSEVFDRALTVLLEDLAKKKFAATEHPQPSRAPAPGSRHIP